MHFACADTAYSDDYYRKLSSWVVFTSLRKLFALRSAALLGQNQRSAARGDSVKFLMSVYGSVLIWPQPTTNYSSNKTRHASDRASALHCAPWRVTCFWACICAVIPGMVAQ